ncbi:MAG: hypothetical protein R3B45_10835 [Bdellovibrionota bacterium]
MQIKFKNQIKILEIGSGRKKVPARSKVDETFFVITESNNLIEIRKSIYKRYISNGGNPKYWNPKEFYPHITIGFSHKDIHYPDVQKSLEGSLDKRFILK